MEKVGMVMFDLSGTTVQDDTAVEDCLFRAAREFDLDTSVEEIVYHLGMNKIHLFQFLIARSQGRVLDIKEFEKYKDRSSYESAKRIFDRYEEFMLDHYRSGVREIPGASDTFRWLHDRGIKVATDTGFHGRITEAIMDGLGWLRDGLVDVAVHVESIPGQR